MEGIRLVRVRTKDAFPCFCVRFSLFLQSSPLWQCCPSRLSVISRLEREKAVRLRRTADRLTESSGRLTEFTGRLTGETASASAFAVTDLRESIRPKQPYRTDPAFSAVPYYQVFSQRQGFLPNLSIVDLLFNMGPEARLVLRDGCAASAMPVS